MKALVTGGAGFIGTNLVERLRRDGHEVRVADLLYGHDLTEPEVAQEFVEGQDVVFHLAADSKVGGSPGSDLNNHTKDLGGPAMMMNLLSAMKDHAVRQMVFVSSSAVYGDTKLLPTPEDAPTVPVSLYGAAKLSAECFARAFTILAPVNVCAFRLGNPLGTGSKKGVLWEFVQRLKKDPTKLEILGDAEMTRSFFDVGDAVEGLVLGTSARGFEVYNLAGAYSLSIRDMAEVAIFEMGLRDVKVTWPGGRNGWPGDIRYSCPSIEKARAVLGWEPRLAPAQAIANAVRWMLDNS